MHDGEARKKQGNALARLQGSFQRGFERLREQYKGLLQLALRGGPRFVAIFLGCMAATALLAFPIGPLPGLGQDFFPTVDGGQIKLHMRPAPAHASRKRPRSATRWRRRFAR